MNVLCVLETISTVSSMGTFLIALCAFILAYREYNLHKIQQKIDVLSKLNERYSTDENIQDVIKWMLSVAETDENGEIIGVKKHEKDVETHKKEMFMRFFEELYLHIQADRVNEEDAYNLFAYYAIKYDEIPGFRENIKDYKSLEELKTAKKDKEKDKNRDNWISFREFVEEMKHVVKL